MMTQFKFLVNYPFKWVSCWFCSIAIHETMRNVRGSCFTDHTSTIFECEIPCKWRFQFQQQQSVVMKCPTAIEMFWVGKWTAGLTVAALVL